MCVLGGVCTFVKIYERYEICDNHVLSYKVMTYIGQIRSTFRMTAIL